MSASRTGIEYVKVFYICGFYVQWDNVECKAARKRANKSVYYTVASAVFQQNHL